MACKAINLRRLHLCVLLLNTRYSIKPQGHNRKYQELAPFLEYTGLYRTKETSAWVLWGMSLVHSKGRACTRRECDNGTDAWGASQGVENTTFLPRSQATSD